MKPDGATPRALSALGSSVNNNGGHFMQIYPHTYVQPPENITISSYYFEERVSSINKH